MALILTDTVQDDRSTQDIRKSPLSFQIRSANQEDIEMLSELWIYHRQHHEQWDDLYTTISSAQQKWKEQLELYLNQSNHCVLVAEDLLGNILGYVHGSFHPWPTSPFQVYGSLNSITVLEDVQGKGIGKNLIKKLLEWFKIHQIQNISLHVDFRNEIALNLYQKVGFRPYQHRLMLRLTTDS
ncbi:MAG: GNAT family N-acetyltransferase [Promethearchaeota archaeon]